MAIGQPQRLEAIRDLAVVAACNDDSILQTNLRRSPMITDGRVPLHVEWNASSASQAYNRGLAATKAQIVIFAHQDVFLPRGWETLLVARIAELERKDPNWALLGSYGIACTGAHYGPVWSSSLGCILGRVPTEAVRVQSYDEHLIVMRRAAGLRFDEGLPGFHLYGTDIVQIARQAGFGAYAMALPLVHNDGFKEQLGSDYVAGYRYMQKKWRANLPLVTPIVKVSWHGLHLARARRGNMTTRSVRQQRAVSIGTDPRVYAALCGWNDLTYRSDGSDDSECFDPRHGSREVPGS